MFPDLFSAMFVVAVTHVPVTRERKGTSALPWDKDTE